MIDSNIYKECSREITASEIMVLKYQFKKWLQEHMFRGVEKSYTKREICQQLTDFRDYMKPYYEPTKLYKRDGERERVEGILVELLEVGMNMFYHSLSDYILSCSKSEIPWVEILDILEHCVSHIHSNYIQKAYDIRCESIELREAGIASEQIIEGCN